MPLYVRFMHRQDISRVSQIDREAFPTEWPPTNFSRELANRLAHYVVAIDTDTQTAVFAVPEKTVRSNPFKSLIKRLLALSQSQNKNGQTGPQDSISGYAGMWILADEAHVTSIATRKDRRQRGIGEALLIALIEIAIQQQVRLVTLEARVSNIKAQNLYAKYGFQKTGVRKKYYLDNAEDAVIMSTDFIGAENFQKKLSQLKGARDATWGPARYDIIRNKEGG